MDLTSVSRLSIKPSVPVGLSNSSYFFFLHKAPVFRDSFPKVIDLVLRSLQIHPALASKPDLSEGNVFRSFTGATEKQAQTTLSFLFHSLPRVLTEGGWLRMSSGAVLVRSGAM